MKKKIFASLPMIGLILGAVAIATELHKPTLLDVQYIKPVPQCQTNVSVHTDEAPVICAH